MKKVAIDIREFNKGIPTGTNKFLYGFLDTFQKEFANKCDIDIVLIGNQNTDISDNLNYKYIKLNEVSTVYFDQIQLPAAIRKHKIDIFFSPYPKVPLFTKAKSIISLLDLTYLILPQYKKLLKNKIYSYFMLETFVERSDLICTISHNSKNDIVDTLDVPESNIRVITLSVGEHFKPSDDDDIATIRQKYNLNKKYILYLSNANPHKNLKSLIKAYDQLSTDLKQEYQLVVCGGNKSETFTSTDAIKYLGRIPEKDLPAVLSGANLFVFPSLYEGFGLPPLEAMACGCPVISSNTSSMPEVLGDSCLYFDPHDTGAIKDQMIAVLNNEELRKDLIEKGLIKASAYSNTSMTKNIIDMFKSL